MSGAETMPAVWTAANVPIARPSSASAVASATAASSSGVVKALAAPCAARPTRKGPMAVVAATPSEATA